MSKIKEQLLQINRTSRISVALYHKFALSIGISDSSLGVLYALLEAETHCSQYDLCGEWSIPKQTINSAVSALQKKGLVSLSPVPGTKNKKYITLTDKGRKFAEMSVGRLCGAELAALDTLSSEERELYARLNRKYNEALTEEVNKLLEK